MRKRLKSETRFKNLRGEVNQSSYPFSKLPFPKLFQDYISGQKTIHKFFESSPFSDDNIRQSVEKFSFDGNRDQLIQELRQFNHSLHAPDETLVNIEKLGDRNTLAIVTGQQLTIYGGPLFTIYKVITAIKLSQSWSKKYKREFVPVFWLADEDHDYDEIASIGIPSESGTDVMTLDLSSGDKRVSELTLNGPVEQLKRDIEKALGTTDFSGELWELLNSCYNPDESVRTSFVKLLFSIFGKYGLVMAGSNSEKIKRITENQLKICIDSREEIYSALTETSGLLSDAGYHNQVMVQQSNLFWIDEDQRRVKIHYENGKWSCDGGNKNEWSDEELKLILKKSPNRISPNVFIRPMIQDALLPTIAYVGGPGEIAYYAQMKSVYPIFGKTMPLILPRFSGTIIESGIERIIEKLPYSIGEYHNRIEELETDFIKSSDSPDIEALFNDWKKKVEEITADKKPQIAEIDPTLENSAGKASATYFSELDKLKGKVYRSLKQQEKTQLDRISKIKHHLFPNGNLQEREVAFIYFMNKYGLSIWDKVFEQLTDDVPDTHKLIYL
jgi:bacillithiol synthase